MTTRMPAGRLLLLVCGIVAAQALVIGVTQYQVWSVMLVVTFLVVVSLPLLAVLSASEPDARVRRLVVVALVLKLAGAMARYAVIDGFYGGRADAVGYHLQGTRLAELFVSGEWATSGRNFPGTGSIDIVTGVLYAVTGPTYVGAFLVFSWLGFWGLYLCFRAFSLAVPDGNRLVYASLVLLLPSLLFWPSSLGKDAWMILSIGVAAYGAARLFTGRRWALVWLAAGAIGTGVVRPHITLIILAAVVVGLVVRPGAAVRGGAVAKGVLLTAVFLATILALSQVESFFGLQADEGLGDALDRTVAQTSAGGSSFDGVSIRNPLTLPLGIVTVLFRPFPFEAGNVQALATSLEGLFLLGLFVANRRRLAQLPRTLRRQPYVTFCVTYALLFSVAFSSFSNFGLLTRQRVQVFPLVLVLLAVPVLGRQAKAGAPDRSATALSGRERRAALTAGAGRHEARNHSTV